MTFSSAVISLVVLGLTEPTRCVGAGANMNEHRCPTALPEPGYATAFSRTQDPGPIRMEALGGAVHGEMGPHPEETMGRTLDWLWANSKPIERQAP